MPPNRPLTELSPGDQQRPGRLPHRASWLAVLVGVCATLLAVATATPAFEGRRIEAERAQAYDLGFADGSDQAAEAARVEAVQIERHAYARGLADAPARAGAAAGLPELTQATESAYAQGYAAGRAARGCSPGVAVDSWGC